ncbi:DCAF6 [Mytilus coruscus]|uniref:DCAF6 n=1 Tax=Mytilus coruscus TaxID=42192 RepID=A0A6J8D6Y4_MYTCO|nr:DCAF6 [Mytilus coruscus]
MMYRIVAIPTLELHNASSVASEHSTLFIVPYTRTSSFSHSFFPGSIRLWGTAFHNLWWISREHGFVEKAKLFNIAKGNKDFIQRLKLDSKVEAHTGCVNTLCWSSSGQNILSGSDDQHLVITDPFKRKVSAKYLPFTGDSQVSDKYLLFTGDSQVSDKYLPFTGDSQIISCSGDGKIYYTKVGQDDQHDASLFDCHFGTTYEVIVVPNEASTFLSCGEDGTVRWFDLRIKTSCLKEDCKDDVLINCRRAVTSLAVNPMLQYQLAIGCSDSSVRLFDRRMLGTRSSGHYTGRGLTGMVCSFTAPNLASRSHRITSLSYSPNGGDVLVSYSSEYVYLFGTKDSKVKHFDKVFSKPERSIDHGSDIKSSGGLAAFPSINQPSTSTIQPSTSTAQPSSSSTLGAAFSLQMSQTVGAEEEGYSQTPLSEGFPEDQPEMSRQPPFKRLRMRGDWSDTGPNARPESERNSEGRHRPLMQRMSDMLTRWLDGNLRRTNNSNEGERTEGQASPQDSNNENAIFDVSQDASAVEGSVEMDGVVSGWQNMPSTSGSADMEVGNTNNDEQPTSDVPLEPVDSDLSHGQDSKPDHGPTDNNTHDCDNSNHSDSHDSSSHSNHSDTNPIQTSHDPNSDPDTDREAGQLEPVISLHYSTEGTTSSTIRLGFARFENLEAGILQRSAENASLSPLVADPVQNQDLFNVSDNNVSHEAIELQQDIDSHDSDLEQGEINTASNILQIEEPDSSENRQNLDTQNSGEISSHSDSTETPNCDTQQIETVQNTNKSERSSPNRGEGSSEIGERSSEIDERSSETPPMSSPISHLHIRPNTNRTEGAVTEPGMDVDAPPPPPVPRQRRIGRSGPSMGDIQLGLEVDNSGDEQDDVGDNRPSNSLERHITAIKLQELYRKRQEEKEKEEMEMRNIYQPSFKMKFKGHRNARTMIKEANFWGDGYVMSGSDCGHIFIWDRHTARLVMLLEGDRHVVNCLQPHPYDPILASSGIDYDIKIWSPLDESPNFQEEVANEIMSRNEIMLEETRDTITVPAAFMLRVLASLNQIRAGRASVSRVNQEHGSSDSE